jgi:uncharacterized membrane protein
MKISCLQKACEQKAYPRQGSFVRLPLQKTNQTWQALCVQWLASLVAILFVEKLFKMKVFNLARGFSFLIY